MTNVEIQVWGKVRRTLGLVIIVLVGTLVFMGIEGTYEEMQRGVWLTEQEKFNLTLTKWIIESPQAKALREQIGISNSADVTSPEVQTKVEQQMSKNFTVISDWAAIQCSADTLAAIGWNTKDNMDSIMYAMSIVSTVGWGAYYPPNGILRFITILYAIVGLPLFATLVGFGLEFIKWTERKLKNNEWFQRNVGSDEMINILMGIAFASLTLFYSLIVMASNNHDTSTSERSEALSRIGKEYTWTPLTSLYYTFTTVTSIGFGDVYMYSDSDEKFLTPLIISVLMTFLIAVFTHLFGKMQEVIENNTSDSGDLMHHHGDELDTCQQGNSVTVSERNRVWANTGLEITDFTDSDR